MKKSRLSTEITAEATAATEPYLFHAIKEEIDNRYLPYLEPYLVQGVPHTTARRLARKCAFVAFIYQQEQHIVKQYPEGKARALRLRSLHSNVLYLLRCHALEISVPSSEQYYMKWWYEVSKGLSQGQACTDVVQPCRKQNSNATKLDAKSRHYIDYLYIQPQQVSRKEIHRRLCAHSKTQGWWRNAEGRFSPPDYRTVARYVQENSARLCLGREGRGELFNTYLPSMQRERPKDKNLIWGADGTAHDALVFCEKRNTTRQHLSGVYIFDYATNYLLACEPHHKKDGGPKGETGTHYIEALKAAIRRVGYRPQVLEIDNGPAATEVKVWCKEHGIRVHQPSAGNARGKLVENCLGRLQEHIIRYVPGWSGKNLRAQGQNSHPSDENRMLQAKDATSISTAMEWMRSDQLTNHNALSLQTLGYEPCDQSPEQLWLERESDTERLAASEQARVAGHNPTVALKKEGLCVQHNYHRYYYLPEMKTETQQRQAADYMLAINPHTPIANKRTLYILDHAKGAWVYTKPWNTGGACLGYWPLKEKVPYVGGTHTEAYRQQSGVKKYALDRMKQAKKQAQQPPSDLNRYAPYQKGRLQDEEYDHKRPPLSDEELAAHRKKHLTPVKNVWTGQTQYIKTDATP